MPQLEYIIQQNLVAIDTLVCFISVSGEKVFTRLTGGEERHRRKQPRSGRLLQDGSVNLDKNFRSCKESKQNKLREDFITSWTICGETSARALEVKPPTRKQQKKNYKRGPSWRFLKEADARHVQGLVKGHRSLSAKPCTRRTQTVYVSTGTTLA